MNENLLREWIRKVLLEATDEEREEIERVRVGPISYIVTHELWWFHLRRARRTNERNLIWSSYRPNLGLREK